MALELLYSGAVVSLLFVLVSTSIGRNILRRINSRIRGKGQNDWPDYAQLTGIPLPKPLLDFQIDSANARPYRPFRWEYHQTMSLKTMEPDWWLELESTYHDRIAQRRKLHQEYGKAILDALPGSEEACEELMQMVVQFLCARYPNQFAYDKQTGIFHNWILGNECNIQEAKPLFFLLEHVPEDFLIMQQNGETGLYHLRAAVSCSAVGWRLREKMGKPLHEIHGPVPYYKEKLQTSMNRYFSKVPSNKPIQRGSWSFEVGQPLYLQPGQNEWPWRETQSPDLNVEDIFLRVDWQTLRRLPNSQALVFSFKALFTPVAAFRNEPYIPHLALKILEEARQPILEYKSTKHVEHKLIPALAEWAAEQEDKGWVPRNWIVRTLNEEPFFPGWENQSRS